MNIETEVPSDDATSNNRIFYKSDFALKTLKSQHLDERTADVYFIWSRR